MDITISGLRKIYDGHEGEPPFTLGVDQLAIPSGKVTFVLGHNGSGKSVLLKLIAGELLPSSNSVIITRGTERWKAHERTSAIVRQNASDSLAVDLTVRENLILRSIRTSVFDSIFPLPRLSHLMQSLVRAYPELRRKLDQPCRNLSGGQRQALAFICATCRSHVLLLLDEFLAATDFETSRSLRKLAKSYAEQTKGAAIVVSHDVRMALSDADRIVVLAKGRVIAELEPSSPGWGETALLELLISES